MPELKPSKSEAIFCAFLLLFCLQSFGAQTYHRDVAPNNSKDQELVKHERVSLLAPGSQESKFFKASTVYNSPPSNSGKSSSQRVPFPRVFSIDSTVDLLDTDNKKVLSNPILFNEPEDAQFLPITFNSCSQPAIENIILACLQTVVLLH